MSSEPHVHPFLQRALEEARKALEDNVGGPFGAVVARGDRIVATGRNRVLADRDPTAHAEVVALRAAARTLDTHELTGCVLYSSCEPCPLCLAAIHWARVDRVVFAASRHDAAAIGFDDARLYEELSRPLEARALPMEVQGAAAGAALLDAWAARDGRRLY